MTENTIEMEAAQKKPAAKKPRRKAEPKVEMQKVEAPVAEVAEKAVVVKRRELLPTDYVTVRNGFDGKLIYKSAKTGEKFVFEGFGDEHEMELQELKKAKSSAKSMFINNWFMIDDPDVIEYLGVGEFYKNAMAYDEFDELANMTAEEISDRVKLLSDGQKETVAHHARRMIADGRIDSVKAITALEKGLGVQLIEH